MLSCQQMAQEHGTAIAAYEAAASRFATGDSVAALRQLVEAQAESSEQTADKTAEEIERASSCPRLLLNAI